MPTHLSDRCKFMSSVMSVIDFVAIMPYYIGLGLDDDNEVDYGCCRSAVIKKMKDLSRDLPNVVKFVLQMGPLISTHSPCSLKHSLRPLAPYP